MYHAFDVIFQEGSGILPGAQFFWRAMSLGGLCRKLVQLWLFLDKQSRYIGMITT